jgi:hypothetical protein
MRAYPAVTLTVCALLAATAACGDDDTKRRADACAPGTSTLQVMTPTSYVCHAPFTAQFSVTNASCDELTISQVIVTGTVTAGASCVPPPDSTYTPMVKQVPAGSTTEVFDLMGGKFCCTAPGCPASFSCDETYTLSVVTSSGTLTTTANAHLDLDGCDEICM